MTNITNIANVVKNVPVNKETVLAVGIGAGLSVGGYYAVKESKHLVNKFIKPNVSKIKDKVSKKDEVKVETEQEVTE